MPLLECTGLVKDFPGKRAVDGVDFHVEKGEIVGLLGPNGAGKTTTFRMSCGLIAPTEGRVMLGGQDVSTWPMYRRARLGMGFLPQDDSIFVKLSVEQNIMAILEYLSLDRKARVIEVDRLLEQFGLIDKRRQIASTLSGGERRRLEIARCLASKPSLILLDEPFTGIDPVTIHSIQDIIADLAANGISILLTDHRERETLTITDRAYIICAGKVLVSGDSNTVLSNPTAQKLYFGSLDRFEGKAITAFDRPAAVVAPEAEEPPAEDSEGEDSLSEEPAAEPSPVNEAADAPEQAVTPQSETVVEPLAAEALPRADETAPPLIGKPSEEPGEGGFSRAA
jgi:lipopolysaccharide export system ATP-binding protein